MVWWSKWTTGAEHLRTKAKQNLHSPSIAEGLEAREQTVLAQSHVTTSVGLIFSSLPMFLP
jgi:hypothetical protein